MIVGSDELLYGVRKCFECDEYFFVCFYVCGFQTSKKNKKKGKKGAREQESEEEEDGLVSDFECLIVVIEFAM